MTTYMGECRVPGLGRGYGVEETLEGLGRQEGGGAGGERSRLERALGERGPAGLPAGFNSSTSRGVGSQSGGHDCEV